MSREIIITIAFGFITNSTLSWLDVSYNLACSVVASVLILVYLNKQKRLRWSREKHASFGKTQSQIELAVAVTLITYVIKCIVLVIGKLF